MTPRALTPAEYQDALQKGLGRALQSARRSGKLIDDAAVLDASLHSRAFDPQLEGNRATWIMEILDAAQAAEAFRPRILAGFQETTDTWDLQHLCEFAKIYAERDCAEARAALYDLYERNPDRTAGWLGVEEILNLDGMSGFLRAAALRLPNSNEDEWWRDFDSLIDQADRRFGVAEVDSALERTPELAGFKMVVSRQRNRWKPETGEARSSPAAPCRDRSPQEIIEEIESLDEDRGRIRHMTWGRYATDEDLTPIVAALFSQTDRGKLASYLQIFRKRALPRFDERLVALAEHRNKAVRDNAMAALAMNAHEAVREFALARLRAGRGDSETLALLARNYRRGDHTLIHEALRRDGSQEEMHGVVWALCDIFIEHGAPDGSEVLLFSYEATPCSNCRERIVEHLLNLGLAPDDMRDECRYDANGEIRALVEAAK